MLSIPVSDLIPGASAKFDYYSDRGKRLISKGVTITEAHVDALRRQNIGELLYDDGNSLSPIEMLLSTEFEQLGDLEIPDAQPPALKPVCPEELFPDLKSVKKGKDGLDQLILSKKVSDIETVIRRASTADQPQGEPLRKIMSQIQPGMRTPEYKRTVSILYHSALDDTAAILRSFTGSTVADGIQARSVVERFLSTFMTDHKIVLNVANTKSTNREYLYHHSLNVSLLSISIATCLGYSRKQILEIGVAGLLHDIGMLLVPESVRFKKMKLTPDEFYEIQKHPILGLHLLERINHLPDVVPIVAYQCHERTNGKGYPRRRIGRFIHRYAQIVQCADIFEAISSPRCYREAMPAYSGMERLIRMARHGLLSDNNVKAFLTCTSLFPVGSLVELNNHGIGRVIDTNERSYAKPVISILVDENGRKLEEKDIFQINLKSEDNSNLQVVKSLPYNYLHDTGIMQGF